MNFKVMQSSATVVAFFALLTQGCSSVSTVRNVPRERVRPVRVLVEASGRKAEFYVKGAVKMRWRGGEASAKSREDRPVVVEYRGGVLHVSVGRKDFEAGDRVDVIPRGRSVMVFKGTAYPGYFRVIWSGSRIAVINVVPLETYLESVVPNELGAKAPEEFAALEAQAVAARTYALGRMRMREKEVFDVYAGVQDQVYRGLGPENRLASSAVRKTRGMVLSFGGDLADAYYCASCGGHTSDVRLAWPRRRDAVYLHGVRDARGDGAFCREGRYFRWRYSYSGRELGEILRKMLPKYLKVPPERVGYLKDVRITRRSPSGRVVEIEIETSEGTYRARGDRIRWILPADFERGRILPSTMFDFEKRKSGGRLTFLSIVGGGNGHGVGMCQNGALGMARKGYTFEMILEHYYPGCRVEKRY